MTPSVSIVVCLDGGAEQALRCFGALAALPESPAHEVVVVDNASTGLDDLLGQLDGDVTVARSPARLPFGAAAMVGVGHSSGEVVVILRGAPEVGAGWLAPLASRLHDRAVKAATS